MEGDDVAFRTRDFKVFSMKRQCILDRAPESWFAKAIHPAQNLSTKTEAGQIQLIPSWDEVKLLLMYLKTGELIYNFVDSLRQNAELAELFDYYLVPMPKSWKKIHEFRCQIPERNKKLDKELEILSQNIIELALQARLGEDKVAIKIESITEPKGHKFQLSANNGGPPIIWESELAWMLNSYETHYEFKMKLNQFLQAQVYGAVNMFKLCRQLSETIVTVTFPK